jgi:hypothetical protein
MNMGSFNLTWDLIIKSVSFLFMGIGLLVIPVLPGLVIIWATALGYGIASGFGTLGWIMFTIITLLMLAGSIVDNVMISTQAHKEGALVGGHHRDGLGRRGKFYHSGPHTWRRPDCPGGVVPDPMAPAQECQNGPCLLERDADWLGMGIGIQVYNRIGHDRPVAHMGLGVTVLYS